MDLHCLKHLLKCHQSLRLRLQMLLGQMYVFSQRHPGVLHVILEWMYLELGIMLSVRENVLHLRRVKLPV